MESTNVLIGKQIYSLYQQVKPFFSAVISNMSFLIQRYYKFKKNVFRIKKQKFVIKFFVKISIDLHVNADKMSCVYFTKFNKYKCTKNYCKH